MTEKADAWVVLRFDGPLQESRELVAVKGVYDSKEEAEAAAERSAHLAPSSAYEVVRSRRIVSGSPDSERKPGGTLQTSLRNWLSQKDVTALAVPLRESLKALYKQVPPDVQRRAFEPLISYYVEEMVAKALNGVRSEQPPYGPDVVLPDGTRIDVKVRVLDANKNRAPFIQFRSQDVDALAIVLVTSMLDVASARLIPNPVLRHFERKVNPSAARGLTSVRITPELLNAPGTAALVLPPLANEGK
jgi:hypothetical protein